MDEQPIVVIPPAAPDPASEIEEVETAEEILCEERHEEVLSQIQKLESQLTLVEQRQSELLAAMQATAQVTTQAATAESPLMMQLQLQQAEILSRLQAQSELLASMSPSRPPGPPSIPESQVPPEAEPETAEPKSAAGHAGRETSKRRVRAI